MIQYDLVVFGATGFTAKFVLTEIMLEARWPLNFSWAIAGRSEKALLEIRKIISVSAQENHGPLPNIIVADVNDEPSLFKMARSTKLLLNCVGPYRHFGEPVVSACIAAKCDYIDLCGEPEFIEKSWLRCDEKAKAAGVAICHAAAYDSVPCDLAVLELKRLLQAKNATPYDVDMFFQLKSSTSVGVHYATYEAAIHGFASSKDQLPAIRREIAKILPRPSPPGARPRRQPGFLGVTRDPRASGWLVPYFFSDPAVVKLTQSLDAHLSTGAPPVYFAAYIVVPTLYTLILAVFYLSVFRIMTGYEIGRQILLKYPEMFTAGIVSKQGPTPAQLRGTSFEQTFHASGYSPTALSRLNSQSPTKPDTHFQLKIQGPEPGYVATPVYFVKCAQAILQNRKLIPNGILTPAIAFAKCDVLEKMALDSRFQHTVSDV